MSKAHISRNRRITSRKKSSLIGTRKTINSVRLKVRVKMWWKREILIFMLNQTNNRSLNSILKTLVIRRSI